MCSLHPLGDYDVNHLDRVARGLHDGSQQKPGAYSDRLTRLQKLPNQHVCEGLCDDCSRGGAQDGDLSAPDGPMQEEDLHSPQQAPQQAPEICECKCSAGDIMRDGSAPKDTSSSDVMSDPTSANTVHQRHGLRVVTSDYESSDSPSSVETSEEALGGPGRVRLAPAAEVAAAVVEEQEEEDIEDKEEPMTNQISHTQQNEVKKVTLSSVFTFLVFQKYFDIF